MATTNELQAKLIEGIQILAENAVIKANLPKTIECEIVSSKDPAIGMYTVSYMGNTFDVYAASSSITYHEKDVVLVLVPDGDMGKTKYIIGASTPEGNMYEETAQNKITKGTPLINFSNVELCSYKDTDTSSSPVEITDINIIKQFKEYIKSGMKDFVLSAKVKTNLNGEQKASGNYGITLRIPIIYNSTDGNVGTCKEDWLPFKMDCDTMEGDVYDFSSSTPQNIYESFPDNAVYDDSRRIQLVAKVSGFPNKNNLASNDIFFTQIALKSVKEIDLSSGNALTILASPNNEFFNNIDNSKKTLSLELVINGKKKAITNSYECYWFVQDASVQSMSNPNYNKYGKYGWKCLNRRNKNNTDADGGDNTSLVTNDYTWDVYNTDVTTSAIYKCVLVQGSFIIEGKIELKNSNSNFEIELATENGTTHFPKDYGEITFVAKIRWIDASSADDTKSSFDINWIRFKADGTRYEEEAGVPKNLVINKKTVINGVTWYVTKVSYPATYIKEYSNVQCSFVQKYVEDNVTHQKLIGTKNIVVTTGEDFIYKANILADRYSYKYDADGDSPLVSNYDGPSSSIVKEINPISFSIINSDSVELTDLEYKYCEVTWYIPKNSMIKYNSTYMTPSSETEDYYVFNFMGRDGSSLYYTIVNVFDPKKDDNTIHLEVKIRDEFGVKYTVKDKLNIIFLKDGQSGTNGTKFSAVITYNDYAYGETFIDSDGKSHKYKFLPIYMRTISGTYYNYDSFGIFECRPSDGVYNRIRPYPRVDYNCPVFNVKVFKDGELISANENIYTVEWELMDPETCKTNFTIDQYGRLEWDGLVDGEEVEGEYVWPFGGSQGGDNDYSRPCNIIKATITISSAATETDYCQKIYAYYPIDMYIATMNNAPFDPNVENNVTDIDGGYWEVIYASDGTNPQYDTTAPFKITSDNSRVADMSEFIDYPYWVTHEVNNFNTDWAYDITSFNVAPANKFDNGRINSYITYSINLLNRVEDYDPQTSEYILTGGIEKAIQDLEDEVADLETEIQTSSTFITNLELFQNQLDNSGNFCYNDNNGNSMKEYLEGARDFLGSRSLVLSNLADTLNKINEIRDYLAGKEVDGVPADTTPTLVNAISEINTIISDLLLIGDHDNPVTLANVPNISFSTLVLQNETDYKAVYGLNDWYLLKEMISSCEELIGTADNQITDVKTYTTSCTSFVNFRTLVYNFLNNNDALDILIAQQDVGEEFKSFQAIYKNIFEINLSTDAGNASYVNINILLEQMKQAHDKLCEEYFNDKYNAIRNDLLKQKNYDEMKIADLVAINHFSNIKYVKPIYMAYNTYAFSDLNNWDGQKLYIDEENDQYMYAPKIGAGYKDQYNRFTGVIMGKSRCNTYGDPEYFNTTSSVGLFGFGNGEASFFLNAKSGSAIFGKSGPGQIIIDPTNNKAELYSSNYYREYYPIFPDINDTIHGYLYNAERAGLPKSYADSNVTYEGMKISLTDSVIHFGNSTNRSGRLYSGEHSSLTSTASGFYLDRTGLSIGDKFKVSVDSYGHSVVKIGLGAVDEIGSQHWTIDADSSGLRSYISYNATAFNGNENSSVYIGTDGIRLGTGFKVNNGGAITATAGQIGGWYIDSQGLYSNSTHEEGIQILSNGSITAPTWSISATGGAAFTGGTIGGWSIGDSAITGGNLTLNSAGSISGNGFTLDSSGLTLGNGIGIDRFVYDYNTNSLIVNGEIVATSGRIGDWFIGVPDPNTDPYTSGLYYSTGVTARITRKEVVVPKARFDRADIGTTILDSQTGTITNKTVNIGYEEDAFGIPVLDGIVLNSNGSTIKVKDDLNNQTTIGTSYINTQYLTLYTDDWDHLSIYNTNTSSRQTITQYINALIDARINN